MVKQYLKEVESETSLSNGWYLNKMRRKRKPNILFIFYQRLFMQSLKHNKCHSVSSHSKENVHHFKMQLLPPNKVSPLSLLKLFQAAEKSEMFYMPLYDSFNY